MAVAGTYVYTVEGDLSPLEKALKLGSDKVANAFNNIKLTGLDSVFGSISQKASNFGSNLTKFITLPLLGLGGILFKVGADFDDAFDRIRIGTGKVGPALEDLKDSFRNVVADVPASFENASQAISLLAQRTTATGEVLEDLTATELELARITGGDLASQLNNTTRLFGDWSIAADHGSAALDTLFRASQQTGTSVDRLSQLMVQFGAPMRSLGFDFEQAAALLGKFEKEGVNTELVMGSLRIALGRMAKEGVKDPAEAFKILTERIKNAKTEGDATRQAFELFGRRAGVDMAKAIREGRFSIDELVNTIRNGKDTIRGAGEDTADFAERFQLLKNKVMLAVEPLAGELFKAVGDLTPLFASLAGSLTDAVKWFTSLPPGVKELAFQMTAVFVATGPVLSIFGKLTGAMSLLAGPLGIGLVIAALAFLVIKGDDAAAGLANMWNKMMGDTEQASANIIANARKVTDALQIAGAAYIGFKLGGAPGAVVGGLVGLSTLPANPTPITTAHPGTSNYSQSALDRFNREAQGITNTAKSLQERMPIFGHKAGEALVTGAADGVKANASKPDAATQAMMDKMAKGGGGKAKSAGGGMAKSLVDGFTDGAAGLSRAFDVVVASLKSGSFNKIFEDLPAKARAQFAKIKDAAEEVAKSITELLKSRTPEGAFRIDDEPIKATVAGLKVLGADGVQQLKNVDTAFKQTREAMDSLAISTLNLTKPTIEINAHQGKLIDSTGRLTKAALDLIAANKKLGVETRILLPAMELIPDVTDDMAIGFSGVTKWAATFGNELEALKDKAVVVPHWAGDIVDAADRIKIALEKDSGELIRMKAALDIRSSIDSAIDTFERYGEQLGKTGDDLERFVEDNVRRELSKIPDITKEELDKAIEAHRRAAIQLPGIWESVFGKLNSSAKKHLSGILDIIGAIPGGLNKVTSKIEEWVGRIDTILKGLHKIFNQIPDGLSQVLAKVTDIFKKSQSSSGGGIWSDIFFGNWEPKLTEQQQKLESILDDVFGPVTEKAKTLGAGIGKNINSGISDFLSSGAGIMAALTGALGLAISTFQSESKTKRFLGGFALGGPIGGLLSVFFGGPNELQKAQNAAALQQARDAIKLSQQTVAQAMEATKQSIIQTASQMSTLLAGLLDFTKVPKATIKAFFKNLSQVMDEFAKLAKQWSAESINQVKVLAEAMGPVVQAISAAPAALVAIDGHFGIAQSAIDRFFQDFGLVILAFGTLAESFKNKFEKEIKKFGERIGPSIGLLSGVADGLKAIADVKPIDASMFDVWKSSLNMIVVKLGELAESAGKQLPKAVAFFAEKIGPGVELWKSSIDALKSMVDIPVPSQADFDNLFTSIQNAINGMVGLAGSLSTEGLTKAQAIAQASLSIFSAIKAAVESLGALHDYKSIASETFEALWNDFNKALNLMNLLKGGVDAFESISKYIADHITLAGDYLKTAILNFASGLNAAASAINGAITLQSGIETQGLAAAGSFATSSFAPSSFAPAFAGGGFASAPASGGGDTFHLHFHGDINSDSRFEDRVVQAIQRSSRRGRM